MSTDFYKAFYRHATDADLLLGCERWANADHLYGFAAECALKALLVQQGVSSDDGEIDPKYRKHIDKLWSSYQNFMQKKRSYAIPSVNPFQDWKVSQRYVDDNDIEEQTTMKHWAAVENLKKIIRQAELDGVLP